GARVAPLELGREHPGGQRHRRLAGRVVATRRLLVLAGPEAVGRATARGAPGLAQRVPGLGRLREASTLLVEQGPAPRRSHGVPGARPAGGSGLVSLAPLQPPG